MKNTTTKIFVGVIFGLITSVLVQIGWIDRGDATPSTTYWTPNVIDIQPFLVPHFTYDNYFTIGKGGVGQGGEAFSNDFGVTMGILPWKKFQLEIGFDLIEPSNYPIFFNAKMGTPEESFFKWQPALEVGIFNVGTKPGVTTQNIFYVLTGKTIPYIGRITGGYYIGNGTVLRSSSGEKQNQGWMVSWDRWIYKKIFMLAADYASGDNAIGGGGVGLYTYFTPNIDLLVGPVWFNDKGLNGKMKWTIQLDINIEPRKWFKKEKKEEESDH